MHQQRKTPSNIQHQIYLNQPTNYPRYTENKIGDKNNKTGGLVLKYGGSGNKLFEVVWSEELVPPKWREGLIVNLFKKADKEDPGNYRGITLLSVVGKVFCKIVNDRLVRHLESGGVLHEGQTGFRAKRSCVDNIYVLSELVQGRLREGKKTYAFFLDVQKSYDKVWRNGLWVKMWELGVRGKIWRGNVQCF